MTFADVGLSTLVTREASRDDLEKDKYLSTAFYSKLFLLISSFLIVIVFAPLVSTIATAQRLIQLLYMIPCLLTLTLFPLFSRYASTDRSKFTALMQKSITVIFWVGLPMILGGIALNKEIISIIFGANYIGAALTFAILLVTVLVVFPNNILTIAAYALDAQKIFILPVFF